MTAAAEGDSWGLSECDREPIHIPGSIQPHGCLLVLREPDLFILQASENAADFLGADPKKLVSIPLADLIGSQDAALLRAEIQRQITADGNPQYLRVLTTSSGRRLNVIAHRHAGTLIVEFEPAGDRDAELFENVLPLTNVFVAGMRATSDVGELTRFAAAEVRRLTGFDRVLVYRFDEDEHGTVVAEDRNEVFPAFLGHRFPASDIPKQARELYRLNRLRLIADAGYRPVPIRSAAGAITSGPLDLTYSTLRSVSPVHVEYMKNMRTAASMSISIVRDGALWGLISCHHGTPRDASFVVRSACDFVGQVLSLQLDAKERASEYERQIELQAIQSRLVASLVEQTDYLTGFASVAPDLLAFANASGAAVVTEEECRLFGATPTQGEVRELVRWLEESVRQEVFSTESLAAVFPAAAAYSDRASGLLAVSISKLHPSFILWFRPEVTRMVVWAGDPRRSEADGGERHLHPRVSFEMWRETVRLKSTPFRPSEIGAAEEFRNAILGIVLRKAEEMADLSRELERSNKELEAFSYSVSHDLRAPFRHIVGYSELLKEHADAKLDDEERRYLATIAESAVQAGTLVDNLLSFSRMGRSRLETHPVEMGELVDDARRQVMRDAIGRKVTWQVDPLPVIVCDPMMMRLAMTNLLSNAVKYTRPREEAVIEVGLVVGSRSESDDGGADSEFVFFVRDNGVGFDMAYSDKLFGVFQRMHRVEDFEGNGIGLANVRRIIARHGGRTWAEAAVDRGATFYFTLPKTSGSGTL